LRIFGSVCHKKFTFSLWRTRG